MHRRNFLQLFGSGLAVTAVDIRAIADSLVNADKYTQWKILQKEFCHVHMDLVNAQTPHASLHEALNLPYDAASITDELAAIRQHSSLQLEEVKHSLRELRGLYRKYVRPQDAEAFLNMANREANAVLQVNGSVGKSAIGEEMNVLTMKDADYAAWEETNFSKVLQVKTKTENSAKRLEEKQRELEKGAQPKHVEYREITHKLADGKYSIAVERRYHRGKWEPKQTWLNRADAHVKSLSTCFGAEIAVASEAQPRGRYFLDVQPQSKADEYLQHRIRTQLAGQTRS